MRGLNFGLEGPGASGAAVPPAPQRVAGNNLAWAIGDSRTRATQSPSGGYNQRYPLTVARQLLQGQMDLNYDTIQGVGGYTTQQVQESLFPAALGSAAKTLIVLCGTNDLGSNPATVAGRIAAMADGWVESASDRVIHIFDECPWGGTTGDEAGHQALRDAIRALSDPGRGINIVPSWQAITGGNDGITPLSDSYRDDVHFAIPGSARVGRVLAASIAPTLPAFDFHGRPADLTQVFATGSVSSNDMAHNTSISAGTVTTSMVTFEGETWLQIVLAGILGGVNVYRQSTTLPGAFVPGTTLMESNIDFVVQAGHENLRRMVLFNMKQSGQNNIHYSTGAGVGDGDFSGSGDDAIDMGYPDGTEFRGTLWTPRLRIAADATQLRPWWVAINSRTSLPLNATILFRRPQCRIVT